MAECLQMIRVHGSKRRYYHEILGTNSRLDALQAAVLRVKLPHLDAWAKGRANRAERYRTLFEQKSLAGHVASPAVPSGKYHHVYNQFTVRVPDRDKLKDSLRAAGIPSEIYYPLCLHLQKAFAYLGLKDGDFPEAEKASREVLSLPIYPELSDAQQDLVVNGIAEFFRNQC
jgi:dTDP-4-amino-4,6-dideoxygalactose transaminase